MASVALVGAQEEDDSATEIDSCTVIDEPGEYVLTTDITDSEEDACIEIQASNVTLDGDGHTVDGVDADTGDTPNTTAGVLPAGGEGLSNPNEVTIRDLTVTDWGSGIYFDSGSYVEADVIDVQARSNVQGLTTIESEVSITESNFSDNEVGINIDFFSSATIADTTANDNGYAGIYSNDAYVEARNVTTNNNEVGMVAVVANIEVIDSVANGNEIGFSTEAEETTDSSIAIESAEARNNDIAYAASGSVEELRIDSATLGFEGEDEGGAEVVAVETAPATPSGLAEIGVYANVSEHVRDDGDGSVTVDVQYDERAVEEAGVNESTLQLYEFKNGRWRRVKTSSVDTAASIVSATISNVPEQEHDGTGDSQKGRIVGLFGTSDSDNRTGGGDEEGTEDNESSQTTTTTRTVATSTTETVQTSTTETVQSESTQATTETSTAAETTSETDTSTPERTATTTATGVETETETETETTERTTTADETAEETTTERTTTETARSERSEASGTDTTSDSTTTNAQNTTPDTTATATQTQSEGTETSATGPGFGVIAAIIALVATAMLAARRA